MNVNDVAFEFMKQGALVISLDFELLWGVHDIYTPDDYGRSNVKQVRQSISAMLELFRKYDVHATFAAVGLIFCNDKGEALRFKPEKIPSYGNKNLGAYKSSYIDNIKKENEDLYFGLDIIERLKKEPNIEIGSHTFSHYYCWEEGQTLEEFEADLKAMQFISNLHGVNCKSIVFPRNMVSDDYLKLCTKYGITSFRGNATKFFSHSRNVFVKVKNRMMRLIDCYVNVGGNTSISWSDINVEGAPVNIQASRFLRPYNSKLRHFEPLRLRRIREELLYAAKNGEMYHLWWHPHNFGCNMKENLQMLEKILQCYDYCREKYNMKSFTMSECMDYIEK